MVDSTTLWVIIALYLALTMYLGYIGWKKTKSGEDFLLAGRKVNPIIIGLSYGATFISTSAIVGFGGMAANYGMGLIWLTVLNIGVGIVIAFMVFGKRANIMARKLNAMTLPELLGKRYLSHFMQYLAASVIVIGMPLYTAAVLIGGAMFIKTTLSVSFTVALIAFAIITTV